MLAGVEGGVECEGDEEIGETESGKKEEREVEEVEEEVACRSGKSTSHESSRTPSHLLLEFLAL